jgi:hypothetical protein
MQAVTLLYRTEDEEWVTLRTLLKAMQLIKQSATVYHFLGALQQKAPTEVAIIPEKVSDVPQDPEWEAVLRMPATIVSQMKDIETLAHALPDPVPEVRMPFNAVRESTVASVNNEPLGRDRVIFLCRKHIKPLESS